MNKVKQEAMLNKYIDHQSSKRAERLKWTYVMDFGHNEVCRIKLNKN